ncbi:hypothetical protein [Lactococcus lactis]|uniref:hypothetical protein n=1 Tax=Lactococcus lactis TaxID=1358 RepID=UPI0022E49D4F|nr:hypothetical protein [Lactococcus lactis]
MSVKVNFSNGESITIAEDTRVSAWNSLDKDPDGYYAENVFFGSNMDSLDLGTSYQHVGLMGLFGSTDWFAIGPDFKTTYKTSAIVSLEETPW